MKKISTLLIVIIVLSCKKNKSDSPPPEPIAAYSFTNNYKNSVSSLLNGTGVGSVIFVADSLDAAKSAISLSGNEYVKVADSDLLDFSNNEFSVAAWIKPTDIDAVYVIIKNEDANSHSPYCLDIYPGKVRGFVRTNTDEQFVIEGKTPILNNVWQHIAMTFSGTKLTIYYNGKAEASIDIDRPLKINTGDLSIGTSMKYFPSASFKGRIDNVKLYDKSLGAEQIKFLANNYNY